MYGKSNNQLNKQVGKTFRRNEGRRPKWDKHNQKLPRKLREFEEERHGFRHQKFSFPQNVPDVTKEIETL